MYISINFAPKYIYRSSEGYYILPKNAYKFVDPTSFSFSLDKESLLKISNIRCKDELNLVNITRVKEARLKK
jgi:hypothetical protein